MQSSTKNIGFNGEHWHNKMRVGRRNLIAQDQVNKFSLEHAYARHILVSQLLISTITPTFRAMPFAVSYFNWLPYCFSIDCRKWHPNIEGLSMYADVVIRLMYISHGCLRWCALPQWQRHKDSECLQQHRNSKTRNQCNASYVRRSLYNRQNPLEYWSSATWK